MNFKMHVELTKILTEHNDKLNAPSCFHRIQITYRMFTPIGANGKLLTLNFHIDTGAATNSTNN